MVAFSISSGVTSTNVSLKNGDTCYVKNGGKVVGTTIAAGGWMSVELGGIVSGVTNCSVGRAIRP